jgi:hypothetical protein
LSGSTHKKLCLWQCHVYKSARPRHEPTPSTREFSSPHILARWLVQQTLFETRHSTLSFQPSFSLSILACQLSPARPSSQFRHTSMRLAIPVLKRSSSKLTIASFGNADTNETVNDYGSMYRVDSMMFESVEIPRTTPPPAIRVSLATTANRSSYDSRGSTLWRDSSVMSLVSTILRFYFTSSD